MLFPGFPGVATAVGLFAVVWLIVYLAGKGQPVIFDPGGKHGEFGKRLLPMYLDITKFVLGLAAGSIVLLVGSLNFNQSGRSLKPFASPLFLVAIGIIYGVLFMILLALNYEHHLLVLIPTPGSNTRGTNHLDSALWCASALVTFG